MGARTTARGGTAAGMCLVVVALSALSACKPTGASEGVSSSAASASAAASTALKELTVDEVDQRLAANDAKLAIFDCNDKETYAQSHVPTAKWVPSNAVTADMLPADKTTTLVFYCANEH